MCCSLSSGGCVVSNITIFNCAVVYYHKFNKCVKENLDLKCNNVIINKLINFLKGRGNEYNYMDWFVYVCYGNSYSG